MVNFLFKTGIGIKSIVDGKMSIDCMKIGLTIFPDDDLPVPRMSDKVKLPFGNKQFIEEKVMGVPSYDFSSKYGCCVTILVGMPNDFTFESREALTAYLEEEANNWEILE